MNALEKIFELLFEIVFGIIGIPTASHPYILGILILVTFMIYQKIC